MMVMSACAVRITAVPLETMDWPSEVMLLRPVLYYPMDGIPAAGAVNDPVGNTLGEFQNTSSFPSSIAGPKGQAWDFSGIDNSLRVRGIPVFEMGFMPTTTGMSMSF